MGPACWLQKRDVDASSSRQPAYKPTLDILRGPRKASRQQADSAGDFTVVALCFLLKNRETAGVRGIPRPSRK